jgi:hypothetical protein
MGCCQKRFLGVVPWLLQNVRYVALTPESSVSEVGEALIENR